MAYDTQRQRIVLFGGYNSAYSWGDTWEWTGTWAQITTPTRPPVRRSHAMAYDGQRQQVVLFGGESSPRYSDTWAFGLQ